jgi:hypothetical protein
VDARVWLDWVDMLLLKVYMSLIKVRRCCVH